MKIYGLWDVEKSNGGASTPKKSRVSSSSESDIGELQESDKEAHGAQSSAMEDKQFEDVCNNCPADFDNDGSDTESTTLKVLNPM